MTKVKAQISNECQMTNAKIYVHPLIQTQPTLMEMHNGKKSNFSISPACIIKIPLNSPLQKGEEAEIPRLIEKLRKR
jgi:hypothetical protein